MYILGWCASTTPPVSATFSSRPLGAPGRGWGRVEERPRPRPVPPPERLRRGVGHGATPRQRGLVQGSPARRPSAGRRAGPTKGGWVGLEKRRARRGASAKLSECKLFSNFCWLFSSQGSRFGHGPVLSVPSLMSARRFMGRLSLPPHTQAVSVRSVPTAGSRARVRTLSWSRPGVVRMTSAHKRT